MSAGRRVAAVAVAAALGGCVSPHDAVAAANAVGARSPLLADGRCPRALGPRFFTRAACACGATSLAADLTTDGFDSRVAPWVAGGAGGDVGVDGGLSFNGLLQVGGGLAVSGAGIEAGTTLVVARDLDVGGALGRPSTRATVGGSARIGGDVAVLSLSVTGTLTTPPGAALPGGLAAGARVVAPVTVAPACPCSASDLDVAAIVAQHRTVNDNHRIDAAALSEGRPLALPFGRFYLEQIQGADLTIQATGRAILLVGAGGITVGGSLSVELAPDAELDLFVAGPVNLPGTLRLGDRGRPGALRVWVAAGGAITVPQGAEWAAGLYAPAADLAVNAPLHLYGSALVGRVVNNAALWIHHDEAMSAPATCAP